MMEEESELKDSPKQGLEGANDPPEYIRVLQQELQNEIENESPTRKVKEDLVDFNILDDKTEKRDIITNLSDRLHNKDDVKTDDFCDEIEYRDNEKLDVMQSPFPFRQKYKNDNSIDPENSLSPIKGLVTFRKTQLDSDSSLDCLIPSEKIELNDKVNIEISADDKNLKIIERKTCTETADNDNDDDNNNDDVNSTKKKKMGSIYYRIVGKRKQSSSQGAAKDDPESSLSTLSNIKDKFWSFMAGESELERMTRLRLQWYKGLLQSELIIVERAKAHHRQHGKNLAQEFENQELQLQKWGLLNILPAFRMQAWARVSRASLLEDMSILATRLLQIRCDRADRVIAQFNDNSVSRKYPLSSYNDFCQLPEDLMHKDISLQELAHRLAKMDRVCSASLHKFRTLLPELESRTYVQRRHMLNDILKGYTKWLDASEPANVDDNMTWPEFCDWYTKRHSEMSDLEKEFGIFVEDEREREGRLFRRWCLLVLAGASYGSHDKNKSNSDVDGVITSSARAALLSPRSILAFIKYFAINIIASRYAVTIGNQEALLALTESLVFRRVNPRIFKYPTKSLQERDIKWRRKCAICRYVDPTIYGVPHDYAFGIESNNNIITENLPSLDVDLMSLSFSTVSLSFSQRLQLLFEYKEGQYGAPYARASRVMSQISSSITSRDITFNLLMSLKWLLKDAQVLSGKKEFLGADLMFPILVQVIINAQIPSMHLVLHFLHNFGTFLHVGEAAYYSTCLEAAVAYILRMEVDPNLYSHVIPIEEEFNLPQNDDDGSEAYTYANDSSGIAKLGEWLRDQQTMEDTMSILQSEGWMV